MEIHRKTFLLENRDGDPIRGDVRTPAESRSGAAIVVCHGFKGFKDWGFFPHVCEELAGRTRYPVVSFNFSGSGIGEDLETFSELDRFQKNTFTKELEDLGAVLDAAETGNLPGLGPIDRFGVLGHSRGGGIAIIRASEDDRITCLATWSSIASVQRWSEPQRREWRQSGTIGVLNSRTGQVLPLGIELLEDIEANADRLDIIGAASRLRIPFLMVHGTDDESVDVGEADLLAQAAPAEHRRLRKIEGAGHTFGAVHPFEGVTEHLAQAVELSAEWFEEHLDGSS